LENGAEALLTKPINFAELRNEIDMRVERAASPPEFLLQHMSRLAIPTNFSLGPDVSFRGEAEVGRAAEPSASVENDRCCRKRQK
jgi:DNA-binding response OmpR family regulator